MDTDISPIAAIAYSKLTLANSIGNADIAVGAGIHYSKLQLTNSILNADINSSAAIAYGKLALSGAIVNSDINSGAAIAYSKLNLTGALLNADINASAAIAWTKVNKFGSKLDDLDDVTISGPPATGDVPTWNGTGWVNQAPPGSGGGEANTIQNMGTAGVGLFIQKTGTVLELKNINAGSTKVTITNDTIGKEVDIDVAASIVSTAQANTFGDFTQQFRSGKLELRDSNNSHSYVITGSDITSNRVLTIPVLTSDDTFDMLGTAQTITGTKTFVSSGIRIQDSDASHAYTIVGSDLAGDRILTLPLLSGNDTLITQALAQPLTNKTIDANLNTISNIGDSNIIAHTSSKITIAAKGQLNTNIVYKDQANTYNAAFDQFFPTSRLLIGSSDGSQSYAIAGSAIAANRTITLPLLTGPDTFVTQAFTQPITNKTINIDSNTLKHSTTNAAGDILVSDGSQYNRLAKGAANEVLSVNSGGTGLTWAPPGGAGAGEANTMINIPTAAGVGIYKQKTGVQFELKKINAGSTKVTITDDTTNNEVDIDLGTQIVATNQANTFGAFNQAFPSGRLLLGDLDGLQSYTFVGSNLIANRVVTWPLLGSDDVVVLEAHGQSITNKTIAAGSNTITGIVDANIDAHTSTKITITDRTHLPTEAAYNDTSQNITGNKTFTTGNGIFRNQMLHVSNPGGTFDYIFNGSAITTSNKNVTLPLLTGDDTFAFQGFANTFSATQTVDKTAQSGVAEQQQGWYVSDVAHSDGYIEFANVSTTDATYTPKINLKATGATAAIVQTYCTVANDTGTSAMLTFDFARDGDATLTTRPLFQIRNNTLNRLSISATGLFTFMDGATFAFGTTTGTKIGAGVAGKIGFYGAVPVAQQAGIVDATNATDVITRVNLVISRLETLGLIATV